MCDDGNRAPSDGCSGDCKSSEVCGNGVVDVTEFEECEDGNTASDDSCVACKVAFCGDGFLYRANGELCDAGASNSDLPNANCRTDCQPRRCGDGVQDTGELCDDGNSVSGDGCSSDCLSLELCRNGYVDFAKGEACDDNNAVNSDGCTNDCKIAGCGDGIINSVSEVCDNGELNANVPDHAGRLKSGATITSRADTWEWNGSAWTQAADGSARNENAMVYDAARSVSVSFGGFIPVNGAQLPQSDTLVWNGSSWVTRTPAITPPARKRHAMAYDPLRGRIVMFGGVGASGLLNDTWERDGYRWRTFGGTAPSARAGAAMAFSSASGKIVLFGGFSPSAQQDTWEWDSAAWSQKSVPIASRLPARNRHAMVFPM